ncbi:Phosphoinositide phosphatase sac1 [Phlyctochytrium planicorne]|nr:Phosphoinositide phosphatase sac1 [Phlyctochytrium planicorne]
MVDFAAGFLNLEFGKFILIVKERDLAARIKGRSVWRIKATGLVPIYKKNVLSLDEEEHERASADAITRLLASGHFFYSIDVDLTNGPQRFFAKGFRQQTTINFPTVDVNRFFHYEKKFLFNLNILNCFLKPETIPFILPAIHGYVGSKTLTLGNERIHLVIISRVSTGRPGIDSSGLDEDAEVAKEVETETIIFSRKRISSFRQLRGSVPIQWKDVSILRETIEIPDDQRLELLKEYLEKLTSFYGGNLYVVDLLRLPVPAEVKLGETLEKMLMEIGDDNVEYFHCNGAAIRQSDIYQRFLTEVQKATKQQQFFSCPIDNNGTFVGTPMLQKGLFRVHCLDCADLSSLFQFSIAKDVTIKMLRLTNPAILASEELMIDVANLWKANSDAISLIFLGTVSLKRYRSMYLPQKFFDTMIQPLNWMKDGATEISRAYLHNIQRDHRQEAFKILFDPDAGENMALEYTIANTLPKGKSLAILHRKRVIFRENTQSTPVAAVLLLRRLIAPREVKSFGSFAAALIWVSLGRLLRKMGYLDFLNQELTDEFENVALDEAILKSSIADILEELNDHPHTIHRKMSLG